METETRHFANCSSPLCLEAKDIDDKSIWYVDEPICNKQPKTGIPNWVKQQKKIVRKAKSKDIGYFTLGMLKRDCIISGGINGIEGDRFDEKEQIKRWFKKHPTKRVRSEKERKMLADLLKENTKNIKR